MNRVHRVAFRLAGMVLAAIVLCFSASGVHAQAPAAPAPAPAKAPDAAKNPFVPEPAPPLPAGMTGSDVNDPRYKLTPGLFDAGETSMGIKHIVLLKKPDAFQLGVIQPDDPRVGKLIGQLGIMGVFEDAEVATSGDRGTLVCELGHGL